MQSMVCMPVYVPCSSLGGRCIHLASLVAQDAHSLPARALCVQHASRPELHIDRPGIRERHMPASFDGDYISARGRTSAQLSP